MNNIYTDIFSENILSQQYEHKQKYTSKRKGQPKGLSKETYDKARGKAIRLKNDYRRVQGYREARASKREWREEA